MIYLSSDLHICHDKEFIYKYRGFNTIEQMNEAIVRNQNEIVKADDDYYISGDVTLGSVDTALPYLKRLNGNIHVIRGNHDTDNRIEVYKSLGWEVYDALYLNYNKLHFYLSHYPTITSNIEKESIQRCIINLYGHTHQKDNFFYDLPFCYHIGVDSHNCIPVSIDNIIQDINNKIHELKEVLQ